jgi:uncharacterized membrane protein
LAGDRRWGIVAGVLGAVGASYAGLFARKAIVRLGLPDPIVALAEDALAIGGAIRASD